VGLQRFFELLEELWLLRPLLPGAGRLLDSKESSELRNSYEGRLRVSWF